MLDVKWLMSCDKSTEMAPVGFAVVTTKQLILKPGMNQLVDDAP